MNPAKISESLSRIYSDRKSPSRIVFWHDEGGEFRDTLPELALEEVSVICLDDTPALELKTRLELEDLTGKYLLYSTRPPVSQDKDWLLSLRLNGKTFYADLASMSLQELGLDDLTLRDHMKSRLLFLKSNARLDALKNLIDPKDNETAIDTKMTAILAGTSQADLFDILLKIFSEESFLKELDDGQSRIFTDISKFDLDTALWRLVQEKFSYSKDEPRLKDLLISLFVTDFVESIRTSCPQSLSHFRIQNKTAANNAFIFLAQWRSSVTYHSSYDQIASQLDQELNIRSFADNLELEAVAGSMTFQSVERRLLTLVRDDLIGDVFVKPDELGKLIRKRREGCWANPAFKSHDGTENVYSKAYDALEHASELLGFRKLHDDIISFESIESAYNAYVGKYFLMDKCYRLFHENALQIEKWGHDFLKSLVPIVERCYCNWYMDGLAMSWGSLLKSTSHNFFSKWKLPGVTNQYEFHNNYVKRLLSGSRSRVYVIISDALRYEAAEELCSALNTKYRFSASMESMLGVLPSYTGLGMAALTPHDKISFKQDNAYSVVVDDEPFASIDDRSRLLAKYEGIAVKADELSAMRQSEGRQFLKNYRLVYVYHNTIDAAGDAAPSESTIFQAVRKAIGDLSSLVNQIINNFNGTHIFITSDHGFLYQVTQPDNRIKTEISPTSSSPIKNKKRYILGKDLGAASEVWSGNTSVTARTELGLDFWIPRGRNLFNFIGGSRFVHGGSMPQEIIIPMIHVKAIKSADAADTRISKVSVVMITEFNKMVTNIQKLEFIQTEAVSERKKPNILKVSLRDGEKLISNEQTLTFDSTSENVDDRKRTAFLRIISGDYESGKEYFLVVRDEDNIEHTRSSIKIDISFGNDFM
jgi:uncharacterized protein (TIGR02687 family)